MFKQIRRSSYEAFLIVKQFTIRIFSFRFVPYLLISISLLSVFSSEGLLNAPNTALADTSINSTLYLPIVSNNFNSYGEPVIGNGDWPMAGANPQRTSWNTEEVRGGLNVAWYRPIEPYIHYKIQPIAANGYIYVSTARGLYAFSAENGQLSWVYPTEQPLGHSPTIAVVNNRSIAYVGGFDRSIHAIDALSGKAISGYTPYVAGGGFDTNPLVIDTTIYAGNRDGYFYAFDAINGALKWRYKTEGPISFSAAYHKGIVYFASNDMYAYALTATTGALVWKSSKLPGASFQSYWPVIYTQKTTGKSYVIFTGGENYQFRAMNLVIEESDTVYPVKDSDIIGPTSTSISGDWVNGTVVIDAKILTNYFESRPDRRTVFVLDGSNGNEYSFDSDGDGKGEYAPFNWAGVTHAGNKYPPIINGIDGVYYQATGYIAPGWVSRSGVVGWKFGTNYISLVNGKENGTASDEPLSYSSGGKMIYWSLCCDREAGSMDITIPYGQPNRAWSYYGYNLANNVLIPGYQQMYNDGNSESYNDENGWQVYSGMYQSKNGVYGKHGSTQSPPIPYQGKLFFLRGNALIAFSPNGTNPKTPLAVATIVPPSSGINNPTKGEITQRLEAEVQKMIAAGPLRAGYRTSGFVDLYGYGGFTDERTLGEIFDYFENPGETVYTLSIAYPYLSATTQQQVKTYLQNNYNPGKKYDFTKIVHIGFGTGEPREWSIIPEEIVDQWGDPYTSPWDPSPDLICGWCGYWTDFHPFSFYAAWKYAQIVGGGNAAFAKTIFDAMNSKLESPVSDSVLIKKPYWLNQYIAGYMGYLELQKLAGYPQSSTVANTYQHLLELRVNNFSKDAPYPPIGVDSPDWELAYHNTFAVARNFMYFTPELGDYLNQHIATQIQSAVAEYEYVAPYWFVSNFDVSYGEGTFQPLYDYPALFQAKAYALKQSYSELAKWIDVPAFHQGDLFYIQNLVAALSAN